MERGQKKQTKITYREFSDVCIKQQPAVNNRQVVLVCSVNTE